MTRPTPEAPGGLSAATAVHPLLQQVFSDIATALKTAGVPQEQIILTVPPSPEHGDLSLSGFAIGTALKQPPPKVVADLASKLGPTTFVKEWLAAGPYLNLRFNREAVAKLVLSAVQIDADGFGTIKSDGESVMIEYVSPNTNKPLHLGHVRNGLLGWSVGKLLQTQGNAVVKTNVINDRGIHIMKSLLAYQKWGNGVTPESTGVKGDHFVGDWYVRFETELATERTAWFRQEGIDRAHLSDQETKEADERFMAASILLGEARELLRRWEAGDAAVRDAWKQMNDWVYAGWDETYAALGLDFDKHYFESEIYEGGRERIQDGVKKGVFRTEPNGAVVAPLQETSKLPNKVLLRGDGTAVYVTQDIHLAYQKLEDFSVSRSLYCVGSEQTLYFQQLFAVLKLLDFPVADALVHLSYGLVFLPEGKMKSREGTVVDADDLLEKLMGYAGDELARRYPELFDAERSKRQRLIALAALKFSFLDVGRATPIQFDPKAAVSFEGRTGPYVQYAYARASSIVRKAGRFAAPSSFVVQSDAEWFVILDLLRYPLVLHEASARYDPSKLAGYLADLARGFSTFYHDQPVLNAAAGVRDSRLALVQAVRTVLKNGLGILGIETLEEM